MERRLLSAEDLAGRIRRGLAEARDVRAIWSRFAPELAYGRHLVPPPPAARRAAVLLLLYPSQNEWHMPLIERIADATIHSGQVSLPGGGMDPDETAEEAALREFEEELGVQGGGFQLCGRLTPMYIYASNFFVVPCVAVADARPDFRPNPGEVASLLELRVRELRNPERFKGHSIHRQGVTFQAPHIDFANHRIWGATSMMLAELAEVLVCQ